MDGKIDLSGEFDHVPILLVRVEEISPSPENDEVYRPVQEDDPDVIALGDSIRARGLLEPLIITSDGFLISGHRRYAASKIAGLERVPCRRLDIAKDHPEFLPLLRDFNLQRVKNHAEVIREELISVDPSEAYASLIDYRNQSSKIKATPMELRKRKSRSIISSAKAPFLEAVQGIIAALEEFWPVSDRQIHYKLLNHPPLVHAGKPGSIYKNDRPSYRALCDLLTRARHEGLIEHEVIADETRSSTLWKLFKHTGEFIRDQVATMFKGFWRDLLQSQENHIEIVLEKLTVAGILRPIAAKYCIPVTIGRGYCSTRPKHDIAKRFKSSGKKKLVLLIVSDLDPDGDEIAHSLAKSLRDDFGIQEIHPVKVALTQEQIISLKLPSSMVKAKSGSSNYRRFLERYKSDDVYELEAVDPVILQHLLSEAIDGVLDKKAFNLELDAEKADSATLEALRFQIREILLKSGLPDM